MFSSIDWRRLPVCLLTSFPIATTWLTSLKNKPRAVGRFTYSLPQINRSQPQSRVTLGSFHTLRVAGQEEI
jgi:hypothetical protein